MDKRFVNAVKTPTFVSVAIQSENGLQLIQKAIHIFPTQAEAVRLAAHTIIKNRKKAHVGV